MKFIHATITAAFVAAACLCPAPAQETAPEATVGNEAAVEQISVREMIDSYLAAKGWNEGENTKGNSKFFVSIGIGVIQAPIDHRGFIQSRVNAYNKAMLQAKAQMAEYLGVAIASETAHDYSEGNFDAPQSASETSGEDEVTAKLKKLFIAKLDNALRAEGVDPNADKAAAEAAAKKLLASDQYRKTISSLAKAEIVGMQVCCSFEGVPKGKKGEIGVIAIWSPKLQAMASAMSNGSALPDGVGKKPVKEQIPADKAVLLSTFGVQQKIDENGSLVLVSYGQAGAATASAQSANAAYDKARMNAMAALREFAGETVAVANDSVQAESVEEFENAAETYEDASAFSQKVKATAAAMKIAGITTIKRWECKHPLAGYMVYGVVCSWSPKQAANANTLQRNMQNVATGVKPTPSSTGKLFNQGAEVDDDAF